MARAHHDPSQQPLLSGHAVHLPSGSGPVLYVEGPRPKQDRGWLYAYLLLVISSLAWGAWAVMHRNEKFLDLIKPESLNNPGMCPLEDSGRNGRRLLKDEDGKQGAGFSVDAFMTHPLLFGGSALAGALGLGFLFLLGTRHHAPTMVQGAIGLQIALPLALSVAALLKGAVVPGVLFGGMALFLAVLFYLWRDQVMLVCHLLGVAGKALCALPGLLGLGLLLPILNGIIVSPFLLSGLAAYTNGRLGFNPARDPAATPHHDKSTGQYTCMDQDGKEVLCCTWQVEPWVTVLVSLLSLATTWTTMLIFEIKVFTVSGAVAQWYFAPAVEHNSDSSSSAVHKPSPRARAKGKVMTSLGHALGPSLGSLCKSSALLTLISYLRQLLEKARRESANNILFQILASLLSFVYDILEALTIFATVRMAMTGQAFMTAATDVVQLLKRNFLDAFGVWWLPPLILQNCALLAAVGFGGVTWAVSHAVWGATAGTAASASGSAWLLSGLGFIAAWSVLSFVAALLLNVVNAVFVCFALDREARTNTRPEVHVVFLRLPTVGPVVEQPDGDLAYGNPSAPPHPGGSVTHV